MENWDLEAVVRGCNNNIDEAMDYSQVPYRFAPLSIQEEDDLFDAFLHPLVEATTASDELEELYKPFYPALQTFSPPTILTSSMSSVPQDSTIQVPQKLRNMKESATTVGKKSRKNQNKRVVKEVKAEDLFSDVWAWRKYGQKPIKGSPYPRSYYRCSSSKGCSARKQVERSCSNPETFIITYSADHNHVHPTRRNSLAGSTRSKFPSSKNKCNIYSNSPAVPNLVASIEDDHELVQSTSIAIKEEAKLSEDDEISDVSVMLEDVDRKLEELDELLSSEQVMDGWFSNQFSDNFPIPWFNTGHSNTVTGTC